MKKTLVYISSKIGLAQAELAKLLIKSVIDDDLIFIHNKALTASQLSEINGVLLVCDSLEDIDVEILNLIKSHFALTEITYVNLEALTHQTDTSLQKILYKKSTADTPLKTEEKIKQLVAITSCPTGIAHTYMAAEALQVGAEQLNHKINIETQGSVGAQTELTAESIQQADVVIIAADTNPDLSRFIHKKIYRVSTKEAIKDSQSVIQNALLTTTTHKQETDQPILNDSDSQPSDKDQLAKSKIDLKNSQILRLQGLSLLSKSYQHVMTGFSFVLAFVMASALLDSVGGMVNNILITSSAELLGNLVLPVFSGYIAHSIASRPALVLGFLGGGLADLFNSDFLGAMIAGFIAGGMVILLKKIHFHKLFSGLVPVLFIPFIGSLLIFSLMYFLSSPMNYLNLELVYWMSHMNLFTSIILGIILGAMMSFHMGGVSNKIAYVFATGLLVSNVYTPIAAVVAAGMVPPLAIYLSALYLKDFWSKQEHKKAKEAGVLGLCFVTEGAIYFAKTYPKQVIPSVMLGSMVASILTMVFNVNLKAPHGGLFSMLIPGLVDGLLWYLLAIVIGVIVSAAALVFTFKKSISKV